MFKNITTNMFRNELERAFDLVARTGFITKAGISYVTRTNGDAEVYRFIDAMNKSGLFRLSSNSIKYPTWTLSELGQGKMPTAIYPSEQPLSDERLLHESTLMNLALEFERHGLVDAWATQRWLMKAGSDRVVIDRTKKEKRYPDLLARTRNPRSTHIAVQAELCLKGSPRYERILNGYMNSKGIGVLLFVYLDDRLPKLIERLAHKIGFPLHALPILFVDLRDLFRNHEYGPARAEPDHEAFDRIISQIRLAIDRRVPI